MNSLELAQVVDTRQGLEMGMQRSLSVRVAVGSSSHCSYFQRATGNHFIFVLHRLQEKVK